MRKNETVGLISAAAIAMLALMIAFSGVALASQPVKPTKETETLGITTSVICNGSVVESQRLGLESSSKNLLDNPPLGAGEEYGKIGYNEKMIGSSGTTNFDKTFDVNTGTAPNLDVHNGQIGYTQGSLGSLSHEEQVGMKVIAAGKPKGAASKPKCPPYDNTTRKLAEWKWCICPFTQWKTTPGAAAVPGSCEEVNTYSKIVATDVQAETTTDVGITKAPVNMNYNIQAKGAGFVVAGVGVYVEDGRGATDLGSKMEYKEKTIGYGKNVDFTKNIGYKSVYSP